MESAKKEKIKWYWYVAQSDEIFLDLDRRWQMERARILIPKLSIVKMAYWYSSHSIDRIHCILKLKLPLPVLERVSWALWLGSDRWRAVHILDRIAHSVLWPDVLISNRLYYRPCDAYCCHRRKHSFSRVERCNVMRRLRFNEVDDFPRIADERKKLLQY